jgi:membrane-associated phospholipid phosphatase
MKGPGIRCAAMVSAAILALPLTLNSAMAQADSAAKHGSLVTRRDAGILGAALAGSALLFGADQSISDRMRTSSLHDNALMRGVMEGGRVFGDPVVIVAGAGLWAIGELHHDRTHRLLGMRSLEAIVVSGIVTGAIKGVVGRARPSASPTNARDFVFARGIREGSEFESFPSGHATAAFAFASAIDAEWGRLSPNRPRWVAPVLYGMATLTATSRVFHDRHWTSDVLMGSAIGFVTGQAVVRWHADRR